MPILPLYRRAEPSPPPPPDPLAFTSVPAVSITTASAAVTRPLRATGGAAPYSYAFADPPGGWTGATVQAVSDTEGRLTVQPTPARLQTITLVVTDAEGTTATTDVEVQVTAAATTGATYTRLADRPYDNNVRGSYLTDPTETGREVRTFGALPDPIPADSITGLTHPELDRDGDGAHVNGAEFMAQTNAVTMDGETVGFAHVGNFYARMADGRAWCMEIHRSASHLITVRLREGAGIGLGSGTKSTAAGALTESEVAALVPSFDSGDQANTLYRLRLQGFRLSVAVSTDAGATWTTVWADNLAGARHALPGAFGWSALDVYDHFRFEWATLDPDPSFNSDPVNGVWDALDLGLKACNTTGSVLAGDLSRVVLDSDPGFEVGDKVVIEVGGEDGFQPRAFAGGVGGYYPGYSVATEADLPATVADLKAVGWGLNHNFYSVLVESLGEVRGSYTGGLAGTDPPNYRTATTYYDTLATPQSHVSKVSAIEADGQGRTVLVLTDPAHNATTGALVAVDNSDRFFCKTASIGASGVFRPLPSGTPHVVKVPEGSFVRAGEWELNNLDDVTVEGAGKHRTLWRLPRGITHRRILSSGCKRFGFTDMGVVGNFDPDGGYLHFPYTNRVDGVRLNLSNDTTLRDLEFDLCPDAVDYSYCTLGSVRFCRSSVVTNSTYVQWQFQGDSSDDLVFEDVAVVAENLTASFEPFKGNGTIFRRLSGVNAFCSDNGSVGTLYEDAHLWFDEHADDPRGNGAAANPAMQTNSSTASGSDQYRVHRAVIAFGGLPVGHKPESSLSDAFMHGVSTNQDAMDNEVLDLVYWVPPALRTGHMTGPSRYSVSMSGSDDPASAQLVRGVRDYTDGAVRMSPRAKGAVDDVVGTVDVPAAVTVTGVRTLADYEAAEGPWGPPTAAFHTRPVLGGGWDLLVYDPSTGAEVAHADGHDAPTAPRRLVRHEWEGLDASGSVVWTDRGRYASLPPSDVVPVETVRLTVWDEGYVEASTDVAVTDLPV